MTYVSHRSILLPLLALLAISITGLGISLDYKFMEGKAHQFMAITHAITVILFLLWVPFGKFYHIIQRPAQLGHDARHLHEYATRISSRHFGHATRKNPCAKTPHFT